MLTLRLVERESTKRGAEDLSQRPVPTQPWQVWAIKGVPKATPGKTRRNGNYASPAHRQTRNEQCSSQMRLVNDAFSSPNDGQYLSNLRASLNAMRQVQKDKSALSSWLSEESEPSWKKRKCIYELRRSRGSKLRRDRSSKLKR